MRQAGRYLPEYRDLRARAKTFLGLCYNPELAAEATLQPIRRFDLDAAIVFSDILVIPHALGRALDFEDGRGPVLEPLSDSRDIAALRRQDMAKRLAPVYRAIGEAYSELPDAVAMIGFAGAPWTIASYMIEGGTSREHLVARRFAYEAASSFETLMDILTDAAVEHLIAQIQAGAEIVQVFDSWAGSLPAEGRMRYSLEPIRRIAESVRAAAPDVPVIVFPRGVGAGYAEYAGIEAVAAVSIDTSVDPSWAARCLQPTAVVQGNLDPAALAVGGGPMEAATAGICAALSGGPHIFNLGHGVLPETPPEHVGLLVETVKEGRR